MNYRSYYPDGWKSGRSGGTPITPEALNHMEEGITDAFKGLRFRGALTASDNMNDAKVDGGYTYTTANKPENAPYANAAVALTFGGTSDASQKVQMGFRYGSPGQGKFRTLFEGAWHPWAEFAGLIEDTAYPGCYYRYTNNVKEWVNPPLVAGTEYRTVERYNGKPVYVCAVDFGNLPDTNSKVVTLPSTPTQYISLEGMITYGEIVNKLPSMSYDDGHIMAMLMIRAKKGVAVKSFQNMTGYTGFAIAKYLKN